MLLYRSVVMNAMTDVIEPALRKTVETALVRSYGANWFLTVGSEIMQSYEAYSDIEIAVRGGIKAVNAMDIPAIIYLLKPKKNEDEEEDFTTESGVMSKVAQFYGWDDRAIRSILRIRVIRNKCYHDKLERKFQPSDIVIQSGSQEKLWLEDLESALKLLDASADLAKYKEELLQKIQKGESAGGGSDTEKRIDPAVLSYVQEMESVRSQYMRIQKMVFSEAPVREALSGAAPWADATDDLQNLSWPLEDVVHTSPSTQSAKTDTSMLNKAMDSLDNGVNKLFNWLNKKK